MGYISEISQLFPGLRRNLFVNFRAWELERKEPRKHVNYKAYRDARNREKAELRLASGY